ncbi:MAG: PKD domain-containing protein [Bacteroidetes bacterium]|nr:PKD domain-containing protein [Bacteroidota bacterium]
MAFSIILVALKTTAQSSYSNLEFVENKGQWDPQIKFKADVAAGSFYLGKNGFTVKLVNQNDLARFDHNHHGRNQNLRAPNTVDNEKNNVTDVNDVVRSHAYRVSFEGASDHVEIIPDKPLPTYNNYFIGNDPSKWAGHCGVYQGITYKNVYPNIDVRYYTNNGVLKYDIIVHPGGNPDKIIMKYDGADQLRIKNKELLIKTSVGTPKELAPASYQVNNEGRKEIDCRFFQSSENTIRFKLKEYSPDATLVIDPTLVFSTFSGSKSDNWGFTATYGPDGSLFAGGIVAGEGFPVSPGAYQQHHAPGSHWDVGIIKLDRNGVNRLYATYLGGQGNEYPHSMIADAQGNLIVFGRTGSANFPSTNKVGSGGGRDIYVTKFSADGTKIIGSLIIGGTSDDGTNIQDQDEDNNTIGLNSLIRNYGDWSRGEVILDGAQNIYVATCTQSVDFPIVGNVFEKQMGLGAAKQYGVHQDGAVIKIDPTCNNVIFSSFLGGTNDDAALVMDISPTTGDLYVGGATVSTDMPGVQANALQKTFQGGTDGFVSIISSDGSTLKATTYLGTNGYDMVYGVKFDRFGFPYVMGTTTGTWPVVNAPWRNAGAKQFVSKLQKDLSAYVYSTTFGSVNAKSPNISPVAFLVDRCQNVYISGWGSFYELLTPDPYDLSGTSGMPFTANAIKPSTDGRDFYFIVIKRDATGLLYGTFFGQKDSPDRSQSLSEHVDGGTSRYDRNGVIYQAICANCYTQPNIVFPTTPGTWSPKNGTGSNGCNVAGVKIAFNFAGVGSDVKPYINGMLDSVGCVPLTLTLQDQVRNGKKYIWHFGDGTPDATTASYQVQHTYSNMGAYVVRLITIDSSTCNISDTSYVHVSVRNDKAPVDFTSLKLKPCQSLSYQFTNTSTTPPGKPFSSGSFIWDFGDGSPMDTAGTQNLTHSYLAPGTYNVRLLMIDTNYCNYPDSATRLLSVSPLVKARFVTPAAGCVPYNAYFQNTSLAGQQFFWDFGDGSTSTDVNPTHLYPSIGSYTIRLTVIDTNTCNIIDSTKTTITVSNKPHAAFTTTPVPPIANTPNVFYNSSTGAVLYKWFFGDGDSTTKTTMDTVIHQYNTTGTFNACLVAYNQYGCPDTSCLSVQTIVNPLFDVPNAFTPGRFGGNGIIGVKGFGIAKLMFRIYNRWGQKVFESTSQYVGWDGTYRGTPQPMDVYAYTVDVEFSDGTKATKKGDITLIR